MFQRPFFWEAVTLLGPGRSLGSGGRWFERSPRLEIYFSKYTSNGLGWQD